MTDYFKDPPATRKMSYIMFISPTMVNAVKLKSDSHGASKLLEKYILGLSRHLRINGFIETAAIVVADAV